MDVQQLVRHIAREVLKQLREEPGKDCVMILEERDETLAAVVRQCLGDGVDLLFFGEDAGGRTPVCAIVPLLSCRALAELAGGRASGPMLSEALRLLLSGTEVSVLEFEYMAYRETAPEALYRLYESYEQTLASFGMKKLQPKQPDTVRSWDNPVTEQTVLAAQAKGASVLRVPATALVTPLAAETAASMKITILKQA